MKTLGKLTAVCALSALAILNTGCESDADRLIFNAQACLDKATTPSAAQQCTAMLDGVQSAEASLVRCQAAFVGENFTGKRLADAFQNLKDNSSGSDPFIGIMSQLVFANGGMSGVEAAVQQCTASGAKSLERLAVAANLATLTASAAADLGLSIPLSDFTGPNAVANMNQVIEEFKDPAQIAALAGNTAAFGTIALTMQSSFCGAGSTFEGEETCTYLADAIADAASSSPADIGAALLQLLGTKVP